MGRNTVIVPLVVVILILLLHITTMESLHLLPRRNKLNQVSNRCRPYEVKRCYNSMIEGQKKRVCINLPKLLKNCVFFSPLNGKLIYIPSDYSI